MEARLISWTNLIKWKPWLIYSQEVSNVIVCIHCWSSIKDPDNHGPWVCCDIRA